MVEKVTALMIEYFGRDARRIHHFLEVYGFARTIARAEGLDGELLSVIELAALTHDIGIKPSEEKYGSSAGHYQEIEGPAPARELLAKAGCAQDMIERVAWLIAHHHQVLVEADFLVNIHEDEIARRSYRFGRRSSRPERASCSWTRSTAEPVVKNPSRLF